MLVVAKAQAYVLLMFSEPTLIPIIGARFGGQRAFNRRAEIDRCQPGEELTLRLERTRISGRRAIGVYSSRGVQIGYVSSQGAEHPAALVSLARAVFKCADTFGAVALFTFDGKAPTLPQPKPAPKLIQHPRPPQDEYCDIFANRNQSKISRPTSSPTDVSPISTNPATLRGSVREQNV